MIGEAAKHYGFVVTNLFVPRFLSTLLVTSDFPLTTQETCPADGTSLQTLCTLLAKKAATRIRIGCCNTCGYVGYIDTPTREWLNTYYSAMWDKAEEKRSAAAVREEVEKLRSTRGKISPMGVSADELAALGISKERPVLEIGGGLDRVPKGLQEIGYTSIVAVDPSKHRAETTSEAFSIDVVSHPFEDERAQKAFKKYAPFSIIYSSHVIEHMHDPDEVIRLCAGLQNPGDYLIFALPNITTAPAGMTLLYISHLHGFTHKSFAQLIGKYGYRILKETSLNDKNIRVVARKEKAPITRQGTATRNYFNETCERFINELDLGKHHLHRHRLWWWLKIVKFGETQSKLWGRFRPVIWLQYYYYSKVLFKRKYQKELAAVFGERKFRKEATHLSSIMAASVYDLHERRVPYEESPIEIQFEDDIMFFYK